MINDQYGGLHIVVYKPVIVHILELGVAVAGASMHFICLMYELHEDTCPQPVFFW